MELGVPDNQPFTLGLFDISYTTMKEIDRELRVLEIAREIADVAAMPSPKRRRIEARLKEHYGESP